VFLCVPIPTLTPEGTYEVLLVTPCLTKPTPDIVPFETVIVVLSGNLTIPNISLVDVGILTKKWRYYLLL
jgi:hypothetical protein